MHKAQRLINHVALVLDGSLSMSGNKNKLIQAADEQVKHLALRSEELSQETRVSVYLFNDNVDCLIFDMDVMRLPSIADLYKIGGNTALVDSVVKSQEDLATTSQLYGDHAFLTFVLTDGQENRSKTSWTVLPKYLQNAPENWTVGFLIPDEVGYTYMDRIRVDRALCAVWDTTSTDGLVEAYKKIRVATDNFMNNRAKGIRGTKSVFSTGIDAVNAKTVTAALKPLQPHEYAIHTANNTGQIRDFVNQVTNGRWAKGKAYYQLTKTEKIQPSKQVVVVDKSTGVAYTGPEGRKLLGLPDGEYVRVHPDKNPKYDIYIQSTSVNRKLTPGSKVLLRG